MKKLIHLPFFLLLIFIYSCGGVIGNIEKYRFENVSRDSLKKAIRLVFDDHPEYRDFDTSKYIEGNLIGDGDYYCRIKIDSEDYFFKYALPEYPSPQNFIVEIALTSAGKYGEGLPFSKNISFFKKNKYSSVFKEYFIGEVKRQLYK